jgi:Xaa-Pro aminopeptidase
VIERAVFAQRQNKLRHEMDAAGLDLVVAYADVWRPGNVFYLTNWREPAGGISQAWCLFLLPREGESILLVGFETTLQAPEIAVMDRVERSDRIDSVLRDVRSTLNPAKFGLIGENLLPISIYRQIESAFAGSEFVNAMPLLTKQRRIKSPDEIELMRKAARISDEAMGIAIDALKSGATEAEIAAAGNAYILSRGAVLSFFPTVGGGPNSAPASTATTAISPAPSVLESSMTRNAESWKRRSRPPVRDWPPSSREP